MKSLKVLMVVGLMMVAGSALAQTVPPLSSTSDDAIEVSATVTSVCQIDATSLAFGTYNAIDGAQIPAPTATITAQCTATNGLLLNIDDGANASGAQNRMTNGSTFLAYEAALGAAVGGDLAAGDPVTYTVTGSMAAGQWGASEGAYADTITVSVSF